MLPVLAAKERAQALDDAIVAHSMTFKLDDAQAVRSAVLDAAHAQQPRRRARKASPEALAAMGIRVASAPPQEGVSDG